MINPEYEKLSLIVDEIKPILKERLPDEYNTLLSKTETKLHENSISILLYGAYNAGKSSLINLLIGESVAKIGDQPVTDVVKEFFWRGLRLLDSPGVNAPIEHENITMEALKSVDLVLFIIRCEDLDSKDLYTRLINLLNSGKHVFLIFNYEGLDPYSSGEDGTATMVDYIGKKIIEYMDLHEQQADANSLDKLVIIPLNIKTADKGLRENKKLLLEHSGFPNFENTFNRWIEDLNNEKQLVTGSKKFITTQLLEPLTEVLKQSTFSDSYQEQKLVLARLENQKDRLETSASNEIRIIANRNQAILQNGFENKLSEIQVNELIENYFISCGEEFNKWLEDELKQKFAVNIIGADSSYHPEGNSKKNDELTKATLNLGSNYLKNHPESASQITKAGLVAVKKYFPSIMKGIGKKTIEKIAGKAVPVVAMITTVYDAYSANSEQDEINQSERNKAHQQVTLVNSIKEEFIAATKKQASEIIESFSTVTITEAKSELAKLNQNIDLTKTDYDKLLLIKSKLEQIN